MMCSDYKVQIFNGWLCRWQMQVHGGNAVQNDTQSMLPLFRSIAQWKQCRFEADDLACCFVTNRTKRILFAL